MDWNVGATVAAGAVATVVMTAVLYMGIFMMPRQMTMNLLYMLGSMVAPANKGAAYMIGAMMHAMMGISFDWRIRASFGPWTWTPISRRGGLLLGFVHYLIVGMGMGMIGSLHPLMRRGHLQAPGIFVLRYPALTAMGFLMVHLVYGTLYETWA